MNKKGPIIALLLVAVGLGIALIIVSKESADRIKEATDSLTVSSNTVVSDKKRLAELETVNQTLETNLTTARGDFSNKLALTEANLRATEGNLEKAEQEAKAEAKAQSDSNAVALAQRDQKISELESQNDALDKEAAALRVAVTNLDARIATTQEKLTRSEGDRAFLAMELKTLKAERDDMEKRINTIVAAREQLRQLRIEASLDRRLVSMRRKMYASFAQNLAPAVNPPPPSSFPGGGPNVELRQSGGVQIHIPPSTNAPSK